ncbi:putative acetyltransferase [Caudoviricetes sp.]|nr:putative acetyltransferase [Caudoviricetes sp.]
MNMRMEDRREIKKFSYGLSPIRAINQSYRASLLCWTVLKDGVPIAMFGAGEISLLSDKGMIWFLGTDEVKKHPREYLLGAKYYVFRMLEDFEYLYNKIDYENVLAVRFARKLLSLMPDNVKLTEEQDGLKIEIARGF